MMLNGIQLMTSTPWLMFISSVCLLVWPCLTWFVYFNFGFMAACLMLAANASIFLVAIFVPSPLARYMFDPFGASFDRLYDKLGAITCLLLGAHCHIAMILSSILIFEI